MASQKIHPWHIQKCAKKCTQCQTLFQDRQLVFSTLLPNEQNEYIRNDSCQTCWKNSLNHEEISHWKTLFHIPSPQEERIKKESAESLLRKLLEKEEETLSGVLFILAVMLERKKLFIERDIQQDPSGQKRRIYEHRKTREIFIIPDPLLRLDQLEEVQIQVAQLLDSNPKKTSTP